MNVALLLKLLPLIQKFLEFLKGFVSKPCLFIVVCFLVVFGVSGYLMIDYVDAKHIQVTTAMNSQNSSIQQEIASQHELTLQRLESIAKGITAVNSSVQRVDRKVWELSRDINRR